jgi:hypothetical protein
VGVRACAMPPAGNSSPSGRGRSRVERNVYSRPREQLRMRWCRGHRGKGWRASAALRPSP